MKLLATAVLVSLACALPLAAQDAPAISGDYLEARSNEVYTCGCLYSGQMTTAGREAILAWRITRGVYQGTALAGVKVAAVVVGEANLGAYDGPRRTALYLDESASDAQLRAIVALWQREYSQALGKIAAVHLDPATGTMKLLWRANQRTFSFFTPYGPANQRVVLSTNINISKPLDVFGLGPGVYGEQFVWRQAATGKVLARSSYFDSMSQGILPTPGYGGLWYMLQTDGGIVSMQVVKKSSS